MSNQPIPPRPRFRLPSMGRTVEPPTIVQAPAPPALPPTQPRPPPESQPPMVPVLSQPIPPSSTTMANGPVVTVLAEPPQPPPQPPMSATIASAPSSPRPKVASRSPTPPQSPKAIVKTPTPSPSSQSPKIKPSSPPPLQMQPSQLKIDHPEPEPPTSPVVKSISPPMEVVEKKSLLHPKINKKTENGKDEAQKKESGQADNFSMIAQNGRGLRSTPSPNKYSDEEDGMRVITIAGENRGAYMELASLRSKNKKKLDKWHNFDNQASGTEGNEIEPGRKGNNESEKHDTLSTAKTPPVNAFVNSNVQSVNNAILFHSSCAHNDPGVHLALSRKPAPPSPKGIRLKHNSNGLLD